MHICERPENTRVGANCNSPFHMGGAIENMGEFAMRANLRKKRTQQHRAICKSPLQRTQKTSCQYQCSMINVQWSMINVHWPLLTDLCSLFTFHSSLFTFHSSLFTDLSPPTSILISHNNSSWFVHQKCCTFASNLKQVLGVSLQNPNTP